VEGVLGLGLPIVVVNDGSTDGTDGVLRALSRVGPPGLLIETHARNRGKAAALRTGFSRLEREGYTHAVTLDTDGQLPVEAVPAFVGAAGREPRALVLGVRRWRIEGCPRTSLIGRALSNAAVWLECGLRVTDTQCGLRVYPLELVRSVRCGSGRFGFETEIIVRAAWAGWPVVQVPAPCTYRPAGGRVTHFRKWRDSAAAAALHARLATGAVARCLPGWGDRVLRGERPGGPSPPPAPSGTGSVAGADTETCR
jgi:glycosyltransferase involved in cell wall biosynthesis